MIWEGKVLLLWENILFKTMAGLIRLVSVDTQNFSFTQILALQQFQDYL